jgi:hypothetical protein
MLVCTIGLIVPAAFHWHPALTIAAATILAIESLVFVGVHAKYRETTPIIMSDALGLLMVFIAYGQMILKPINGGPVLVRPVRTTSGSGKLRLRPSILPIVGWRGGFL